ncbi:MAG: hypothetical protein CMO21_13275 [Thioclava sp.]|nr:hypothetical protein [Thioclava sp.]
MLALRSLSKGRIVRRPTPRPSHGTPIARPAVGLASRKSANVPQSVALIGSGATAIYALKHLIEISSPLTIHIFEREREIGPGMPYRNGVNHPQMLANIGSREIPPVVESLEAFLLQSNAATLVEFGITRAEIGPEAFYPRVVLGRYFIAQIAALIAKARGRGHSVEVRSRHTVVDVEPTKLGTRVKWETPHERGTETFNHVILATGHQWRDRKDNSGVQLHSPWPAESLRRFIGCAVGLLGSSLTAIDAAVALASFQGRFEENENQVRWVPHAPDAGFTMVMMSRRGVLPDADWYYPHPLPPLSLFTHEALSELVKHDNFLINCQSVLAKELEALDPAYAARTRPAQLEGFAQRHFADRLSTNSWEDVRSDLSLAKAKRAAKISEPWRVGLLAAHEVYQGIVQHLTPEDRALFDRELLPVFSDVYASVPHRSIERMLALHDAGVLELVRLGEDYTIAAEGQTVRITGASGTITVEHLIDARGQRPADLTELMFPTLRDAADLDPETLLVSGPHQAAGTITCVAIPVVLKRNPFVQGLENAEALGRRAAQNIADAIAFCSQA